MSLEEKVKELENKLECVKNQKMAITNEINTNFQKKLLEDLYQLRQLLSTAKPQIDSTRVSELESENEKLKDIIQRHEYRIAHLLRDLTQAQINQIHVNFNAPIVIKNDKDEIYICTVWQLPSAQLCVQSPKMVPLPLPRYSKNIRWFNTNPIVFDTTLKMKSGLVKVSTENEVKVASVVYLDAVAGLDRNEKSNKVGTYIVRIMQDRVVADKCRISIPRKGCVMEFDIRVSSGGLVRILPSTRIVVDLIAKQAGQQKVERTVKKDTVKNNAAKNDAIKNNDPVKNNAVKNNAVKNDTVKNNAVKKNAVTKDAAKKNTVKNNAVKKDAVKNNDVKNNAVKNDTVKNDTVKKDTDFPDNLEMEEKDEAYNTLYRIASLSIEFSEIRQRFEGVYLPKGILLHGPPGVGKTHLVRRVLANLNEAYDRQGEKLATHLKCINGPDLLKNSNYGTGSTEAALRDLFKAAEDFDVKQKKPAICVLFFDEMDSLFPKRQDSSNAQNRLIAQMLTLMDGMGQRGNVIVIGATNLPNSLDEALRRPGRFDKEIGIKPPNVFQRQLILESCVSQMKNVNVNADLAKIAEICIGYVGADIAALCREATLIAIRNRQILVDSININLVAISCSASLVGMSMVALFIPQAWLLFLTRNHDSPKQTLPIIGEIDFINAMARVGASSQRADAQSQLSGRSKNSWNMVGGQDDAKRRLQQAVEWPMKYPDAFLRLGLSPPRGILCYGPPGCSKTSLIKAAAAASNATFLSISGADVYSAFVGESEEEIRKKFRQARAALPAIIFLDEIDAIVSKRDTDKNVGSNTAEARVLSALLNEMDGVDTVSGLLIVAATNRPDMIDKALLRPGRFDRLLYIGYPSIQDRLEILKIHTRAMQLGPSVDLDSIATQTNWYSGAELQGLCFEAGALALRENLSCQCIEMRHFQETIRHLQFDPVKRLKEVEGFAKFSDLHDKKKS